MTRLHAPSLLSLAVATVNLAATVILASAVHEAIQITKAVGSAAAARNVADVAAKRHLRPVPPKPNGDAS